MMAGSGEITGFQTISSLSDELKMAIPSSVNVGSDFDPTTEDLLALFNIVDMKFISTLHLMGT